MDIFTVTYCSELEEPESIPWVLSFSTLRAAALHVLEEAFVMSVQYGVATPDQAWVHKSEYSLFTQTYSPNHQDSWTITKTELVDHENYLERNSLEAYNTLFRMLDGVKES